MLTEGLRSTSQDGRALSLWLDTQERMKHLSKEDMRKKRRAE